MKSVVQTAELCAGEWVEVRSKEEILKTLDKNGGLDNLPFMPQMFQYCGKRFMVFKRAHKTCDTVRKPQALKMASAVHLEGLRCDGEAYGGCQAECLLFWKEAWLKRVSPAGLPHSQRSCESILGERLPGGGEVACTEEDVRLATSTHNGEEPVYVCQATQLPHATTPLPWWDLQQYVEDYLSGNVSLKQMVPRFVFGVYFNIMQAGIGLGGIMRWAYDTFQAWTGGPYPKRSGVIPAGQPTPTSTLNLQPGQLVRVKSYNEILATLDSTNKNQGLYFDCEQVPFCGGTYRVHRRMSKLIDEKTGRLIRLKTPAVILEDVWCRARYSDCRPFCPRSIYSYWREIWLERLPDNSGPALPQKL